MGRLLGQVRSSHRGYANHDCLLFFIDTDWNANTGLAGSDYIVRIDYDQVAGYYMQVVNTSMNAAEMVYGFVETVADPVQIYVPDYLLPTHHYSRFYVMSANRVGGTFDVLPQNGSDRGYCVYADPATYGPTTTTQGTTTTTRPASTTTTSAPPQFADVPLDHPYAPQIVDLASRGIVKGVSAGAFHPDGLVTRQQFAKMIVKALSFPVSEADVCPFRDVGENLDLNDSLYPDKYVAVCAARGITTGTASGQFVPHDNMTRAQLITMVARAANLSEPPAGYSAAFGRFNSTHYPFTRKRPTLGCSVGWRGWEQATISGQTQHGVRYVHCCKTC